ncbi:hypothetical protein Ancab_030349 [Ancistrocladus abbreviatus]
MQGVGIEADEVMVVAVAYWLQLVDVRALLILQYGHKLTSTMFDKMKDKDVIASTSAIGSTRALELFDQMVQQGRKDKTRYSSNRNGEAHDLIASMAVNRVMWFGVLS